MWKQKLGLAFSNYKNFTPEMARLAKSVGFDAISPRWEPDTDLRPLVQEAKTLDLTLQSLHAPDPGLRSIWSEDEAVYQPVMQTMLTSLEDAARWGFSLVVMHVWNGFDVFPEPTSAGLDHFGIMVDRAGQLGLRIAFENAEGEEHLFAVLDHFSRESHVGYCWDSGHEMCYNHSMNLLGRYGQRLLITHINDNLGISRFDGKTYWTDDLHLLPFDGIADWELNAARLAQSRVPEYLNFELCPHSKPGRHEGDAYARMSEEEFFTLAYMRACRFTALLQRKQP